MHAIFDLDGTLTDSVAHNTAILNVMLADRGSIRRLEPTDVRPFISVGGEGMMAAVLGSECKAPAEEIAEFRARYGEMPTPPDCLFQGVVEGLDSLVASGIALSICSNKPQALCEKVLTELGIADRFTAIVGGQPGHQPKPAPDLLNRVLELAECSKASCCFVGDSEPDLLTARAVGMPFILASYGYTDQAKLFKDALPCACFEDVVAAVNKLLVRPDVTRTAWSKAAA